MLKKLLMFPTCLRQLPYSKGCWLHIKLAILGMLSLSLLFPSNVGAHPLDEFYQSTYITMIPNRITMQVELYTGVLVVPQILAMVDTNQDDKISEAESGAYIDLFIEDVICEIDDIPTRLTPTDIEFPTPLDLKAWSGWDECWKYG